MSYFADLTPHSYTSTDAGQMVLNVGWLDGAHPFATGRTSEAFRAALRELCATHVICLHRGTHYCHFCPPDEEWSTWRSHPERHGNGQIRVRAPDGTWYAAPTMVSHYVDAHGYCPPDAFIAAVLHPLELGRDDN